ncbi:MAG: cellulose biosynthesis cyclic di-GMP-binding regulatory protein BcsB [Desulfobulbaceae bacterium]|nr:cellulose biosynthesis cyclic di-GMP-binding regulatory protein BcsB [Desulfobulbaceae bacterium]
MSSESALTKFNTPGTVKLEGERGSYTVSIPLPDRWLVKGATLRLAYTNSTALLKKRSRIMVHVNGSPVAQAALLPESPEGIMTVQLPARLLKTGYNNLSFLVSQNFSDSGCVPASLPEVWTSLNLFESSLELSYELRDVPLSLNSISSFLFDSRMYTENQVHLIVENLSTENTKLASLAASGVALRFDYRPVHFSLGRDLQQGVDNIIIGSSAFLQSVLDRVKVPMPSGNMGILHLPSYRENDLKEKQTFYDAQHGLLYLTGQNPEKILQAAEAFSLLSLPLQSKASADIEAVAVPEITRYSGKQRVAPGKKYRFRELGFPTTSFQGFNPGNRGFSFSMPTSLLLMENRSLALSFNLSYASNMREDSSLKILLNGRFVSSIPVGDVMGGRYQGYKIDLPLFYVKPGLNTLEFHAVLTPLHTGDCEMLQTDHLALTVFDNSIMSVPDVPHWAELPNLEFLMDDGFPVARYPDFRETVLLLTDKTNETATAAVNLIALLSQKNGVPPFRLTISDTVPADADKELLVVGARESLPEKIINASQLSPAIQFPVNGRLAGSKEENNWLDRQKERFLATLEPKQSFPPDRAGITTGYATSPRTVLLTEFESPFKAMRSIVLFTGNSGKDLVGGVNALWDHALRSKIKGDRVLIDFGQTEPTLVWDKTGAPYYSGNISSMNWLANLVNSYPKAFFAIMLAVLLLTAFILLLFLKRWRHKRFSNDTKPTENDSNAD